MDLVGTSEPAAAIASASGETTLPRDVMRARWTRPPAAACSRRPWGESHAMRPCTVMPPCLPCLRLLPRAAAALHSAAADLDLAAALAHDRALATALVLADAVDVEADALVAALARLGGS
jgi:hypothetical protein